ncbi:DUF1304 domain-containing protein [Rhizobium halophytocola]|uniref:Membrane protein n=1 Tax=Rhizobium halophytocola TaxID=735519 RepID=A0ABS4DX87_9HYPH|nr:DUF1304 domain-containing protein [Rhizobium halophytocola]MBP1850305.1 putative membrane protein [Rhizobium halophytocola]
MHYLGLILVALVAVEHVYILVLEMFLWTRPRGLKAFGMSKAQAEATRVLAANQGLYNGFLAAGLFWSLLVADAGFATALKLFFLGCVVIAGLYGGLTASRRILLIQAFPAALAFLAVLIAG